MAEKQGRYTVVDTTLNKTDSTVVEDLSGRQGDNGRIVYFAMKDNGLPHDLTNQDVTLKARDSADKIKVINGINEMISATAGLFSMYIPNEMYEAVGDIKEAFLTVTDNKNTVVSTIPIMFTVFENGIVISTRASQDYIDSIQKIINEVKGKLDGFQSAYDKLKATINDYVNTINSNAVAVKNKTNEFKENNTFDKDVIVKGAVKGKVMGDVTGDLHGKADDANKFGGHTYAEALSHPAFKVGTKFFAHRGAQKIAPENSLVAMRKIANHSGMEIDIHVTKDGHWVVMHDGNIDRMTSKSGAISSYNFADLRKIPISKGSKAGQYEDSELVIPTLEEALTIAKDKRIIPVIEIKKDSTDNYTAANWDSLIKIIKKFNVQNEMMFISFDYGSLQEVKKRLPVVEVSYLVDKVTPQILDDAVALGVNSGVDVNIAGLTAQNVIDAHNRNLNVGAWTPNDDSKRETLLSWGVDSITTNSLSGELRYEELQLVNGWKNHPSGYFNAYVTEIAPQKIQLHFLVYGGTRTKGTAIAKLPKWAMPHTAVWGISATRMTKGTESITISTFDIDGKGEYPNTTVKTGLRWDKGDSKNDGDWVNGSLTYYI